MIRAACLLVLLPLLAACAELGNRYAVVPAQGTRGRFAIETRVDSPVAASYLATGDVVSEGAVPACSQEALSREALAAFSAQFSVDTAAIFAARCLLERNQEVNATYAVAEAEIRAATGEERAREAASLAQYTLLFVPGWNYVSSRDESGADFRRPRELFTRLGVRNVLVPIDEHGSVEQNALTIADTLDALGGDRPVIMISASSGGSAVAEALGGVGARPHPQVAGWVNIGGILHGMPYLDYHSGGLARLAIRLAARTQGWPIDNIDSMNAANSIARMKATRFPTSLAILNYVGVPVAGEVSWRARGFYERMRRFGPNDGFTLITDAIAPGGETVVVPGKDHFFSYSDEEMEIHTLAMTRTLLGLVAAKRGRVAASR